VIVITDGAAVYNRPDFDSSVQDYLAFKTPVVASKKPVPGVGGLGLFHRIRYKGKEGYIPDTDIRASGKEGDVAEKKKTRDSEKKKSRKEPLYFTRTVGGAFAMVNYSERYSGKTFKDTMPMYGLRLTGPELLFEGPPLDINLLFSFEAPDYLSRYSNQKPSGFLAFGDIMALFPLINLDDTIVNYGFGLMWTYSSFKVPVKAKTSGVVYNFDSQDLRFGVDVGVSVGTRFGPVILRTDVKYFIEKTQYLGYMASLQTEF